MSAHTDALLAAAASEDEARADAAVHAVEAEDEPSLLAALAQASDHAPDAVSWWLLYALSRCGSARSVPAVAARLDYADAELRSAAVMTLGNIGQRDGAAVRPVTQQMSALLADDDGLVRRAAADALARCGDVAVPALAAMLQGPHEGARSQAMSALRRIATLEAAKIMYPHLEDANYLVRTWAYEGLDEMGLLENILLRP